MEQFWCSLDRFEVGEFWNGEFNDLIWTNWSFQSNTSHNTSFAKNFQWISKGFLSQKVSLKISLLISFYQNFSFEFFSFLLSGKTWYIAAIQAVDVCEWIGEEYEERLMKIKQRKKFFNKFTEKKEIIRNGKCARDNFHKEQSIYVLKTIFLFAKNKAFSIFSEIVSKKR